MTDAELHLISLAVALRIDETASTEWFCPEDGEFATAARLFERGWLNRRWHGRPSDDGADFVYRLTDKGLAAMDLSHAIRSTEDRMN
jgi:hypothetical protein